MNPNVYVEGFFSWVDIDVSGISWPIGEGGGNVVIDHTAPIANAIRITGEYQFTEDNELDYSGSFTDASTGTITFTELPSNTVEILVDLTATDTGTSPQMEFKRTSGGTNTFGARALFADAGANLIRGTYWLPTSSNTIYKTIVTADIFNEFKIIGYKVGE